MIAPSAQAAHAAEACPNAQLRAENGSLALPDCRAYELVSPVQKNGGAVQGFGANFGGGVLQAAADGEVATFSSSASFGAAPLGAPPASQYLARRTQAGWSTENITQPTLSGAYGEAPDGVPYRLFSADLARAVLLNGARCAEGEPCPHSYSLRDDESGALTPSPAEPDMRLAGASPDLRHVVLSTCAALTPDATKVPTWGGGCEPAETNLYEWSGAQLGLINDPSTHHASLAAQADAISSDGRRVYFTEGEDSPILLHEEGLPTKSIEKTVGGAGSFQTASADGSLAFFTVGGGLYRYDAPTEATSELLATGVKGVLGASADGSAVYYQNAAGLFLWQAPGTTIEVTPGPEAAQPSDWPPTTGTARVSADGETVLFLSKAQLSGYDNTDQATGQLDSEVFRYQAGGGGGGSLTCLSCNPSGARPLGPSTIPGAIANGTTAAYKPRDLSAGGRRVFFDSADRIVPTDASAAADVYEWEAPGTGSCGQASPGFFAAAGGCLNLISSGASAEASSFIDASTDGRDAFFISADSLIATDPGSIDLYDAREGGGFPLPPPQIPCQGDACQAVPSPPEDPTPGTLVPGLPNPPVHFTKPGCPKGTHRLRRHGKSRCVAKHHHSSRKRAAHNRGGRR